MKLSKILLIGAMAGSLTTITTYCKESFLDENLITGHSTDYFKTQAGLDDLVTGAYQKLKFKFNYIWAINCHNLGVDEFTDANNTMVNFNHYGSTRNSAETGSNQPMWDN